MNSPTSTSSDEKKAFAKAKTDHDLHVLLIMRTDNVAKAAALVTAYREGTAGLAARLAK